MILDRGYTVQRTDEARDCDRTDAVPGVRYETSDGGAFYLWTYRAPTSYPPDDWYTDFPSTALHRRTFECNYPPSRIYASANLVLVVPVEETSDAALFAGETVRYLGGDAGGTPPRSPADDGQIVIPLPASGTPFGGVHLLRALDVYELAFFPFEQLECHGDMERVHQYAGPLGEGHIGEFELWVYQDIAALEAEWEPGADGTLGEPGVHRYRSPQCDFDSGSVYRNGNLLLLLEEWAWTNDPTTRERVIEAFLGLQP